MPFMRPLRLLLSLLSCIIAITILLYTTLQASAPQGSTDNNGRTAIHSLFSFHTPSSLFPPSAIISLTDDNSTFFLARPAAFGPTLPSRGLSGQLWIGSGFGDDSLNRGGIVTGAEGELGCSDVPGWTGTDQKVAPNAKSSARFTWGKKSAKTKVEDDIDAVEDKSSGREAEDLIPEIGHPAEIIASSPPKDDGTDDYLHQAITDAAATKPSDSIRRKRGKASTHADIQSIQESAEIAGKVVLLSRGGCGFLEKVKWVQRRGGNALIVGDDVRGGPLVTMYARGDTSNVTIPALFTSKMTAHLLAGLIPSGGYLDGFPVGDDATLPAKTGPNKKFAKGGKGVSPAEHEGDASGPTFTTTSTMSAPKTKLTMNVRSSSNPSRAEHVMSAHNQVKQAGLIRSIASAFGLISGSSGSQRQDSRRPPSSGQVDWVLDEWKDSEFTMTTTSKSTYVMTSTSKAKALVTSSTSTTAPGRKPTSDDFVIGVHDWRDPDLVVANADTLVTQALANHPASRSASTHSTSSSPISQLKGGSITPGSGEYGLHDDRASSQGMSKKQSLVDEPSNEDEGSDEHGSGRGSRRPTWAQEVEDVSDHHNSINAQNTKSTRPHPASPNVLNPSPSKPLSAESRDGLWVTLTPTSMSSSPFFDTLLVLVVSPLVTLTVVYALLLLRSRIRRRRWRAPKSVVERLPVRTYQTLPSSTTSSGSPIVTPLLATSTTPLLQSSSRRSSRTRPRARTASSIPTPMLTRAIATEETHGEPEEPGEGSYAQQEKRDAGLDKWRRRYGGKQRECVVCLEEYVDGVSQVMSLPCGHEFHQGCM